MKGLMRATGAMPLPHGIFGLEPPLIVWWSLLFMGSSQVRLHIIVLSRDSTLLTNVVFCTRIDSQKLTGVACIDVSSQNTMVTNVLSYPRK